MSKREIEKKFDEIVAFAELEKFIDTPVKHYSSGMYVRLAFAVAAHLEPEILLVDEVLAVGDINFQKKCLGKMGDVARAGRTVILVSHNMAAITSLCSRSVVMESGQITFDGSAMEATARYYSDSLGELTNSSDLRQSPRKGNGKAHFTSISIRPQTTNREIISAAIPGCNLAIIFYDSSGYRLIDANTAQKGEFVSLRAGQSVCAHFLLREVLLKPGKYFVGLWVGRHCIETVDDVERAAMIDFIESEETSLHSVIYPGTYLCRFDMNLTSA
jgi:ABC-type multidrug transport system ATPase subunit